MNGELEIQAIESKKHTQFLESFKKEEAEKGVWKLTQRFPCTHSNKELEELQIRKLSVK